MSMISANLQSAIINEIQNMKESVTAVIENSQEFDLKRVQKIKC